MSRDSHLRILCYDISCNKRRRRVATLLEDQATRVQESVFEARLTNRKLSTLVKALARVIDTPDSLRVYTIGKSGEGHCTVLGMGIPIEIETGFWLV
jgi:CRISPR-associated protein Cas2